MFPARTARLRKERLMAFFSDHRAWIVAAFAAANTAACSLMAANEGFGGNAGAGGIGFAGNGGSIDYDAGTGGSDTGNYSYLCGAGQCDVAAQLAALSCVTGGSGGSGGSTNTGGSGGSGGSTNTGGAGGSTMTGTGGAGGSTNTGGAGGSTSTGGAGGSTDTNTGGAGGSTMTGGAGGSTDTNTGGTGGAPGDVACKLTVDASTVSRSCVPSGSASEFAPCTTAADCGPGLGCVLLGDQPTGVCRTYCCGDTEECVAGTYCAPRPMAEAKDRTVEIPVCVDADDCTLLAPGQCPPGTGCFVVRGDGTTSCIPPGPGKQGESCPCAEGYACTKLDDVCFKICHSEATGPDPECDPGYSCQGNVATLPDGFGLCVSTSGFQ